MATQLIMANNPEEAAAHLVLPAALLAGGTEINRLGSEAAKDADLLISLKKCSGLSDIEDAGDNVRIGSMCTFQQIIESDKTPEYLKEAAHFMASRTKRNMATIGGNIGAKRDDSYLLPVLFAVCARVEVLTADEKKDICINSFIEESEAGDKMLITAVIVPKNARVASKRYSNTAQSHAAITMSAAVLDKGITLAAAVKNSGIYRFRNFEQHLSETCELSEEETLKWFDDNLDIPMGDDMFGSVSYKRYLIGYTAFDLCRQIAGSGKEA